MRFSWGILGDFLVYLWATPSPEYIGESLGSQLGRGFSPKSVLATRRSPTRIPRRNAADPGVLVQNARDPSVWALDSRKVLFLSSYDLVDLPTWSNVGFRGLESSLTLRILP